MDECKARNIFHFMQESFILAMWSPECNIIALVLITRLATSTDVSYPFVSPHCQPFHECCLQTTLNCNNWDKILLCALMLSQKVRTSHFIGMLPSAERHLHTATSVQIWDDTPLSNVDFPAVWQNVYVNEEIDLLGVFDVRAAALAYRLPLCCRFCSNKSDGKTFLVPVALRCPRDPVGGFIAAVRAYRKGLFP
jgi:hypothetical protein